MQIPLNQLSEIAAAFKEDRRSLQTIHSPSISNEDVEQKAEDSLSDDCNGEEDEEQSSHYDAGKLITEEVKKCRILWGTKTSFRCASVFAHK